MKNVRILGVAISGLTMQECISQVTSWVIEKTSDRGVTFSNTHMLALAMGDPGFHKALLRMDMNCPDGTPLKWVARYFKGNPGFPQVSGPDFMPEFCNRTAHLGFRHYLYGAAPGVAQRAAQELLAQTPDLKVAGYFSPPFRSPTEEETQSYCDVIRASGADIVWVSLGCPKQEWWIDNNRHRLPGVVLLAVGQAFDILAGTVPRAPQLLRRMGLEWFYRFLLNPRRLWRRYLIYNTLFIKGIIREHVGFD